MTRRERRGTEETDSERKIDCGGGSDGHFIGYGSVWVDDITCRSSDTV